MSLPMHPMPREGTETSPQKNLGSRVPMHPMPREGTETPFADCRLEFFIMHPMPREGTETLISSQVNLPFPNASYAP